MASNQGGSCRVITTPWGDLMPRADLLPVVYLLLLYGVMYFLPFGVFDFWRKGEDGAAEWLQFLAYAGACLSAFWIVVRGPYRRGNRQWLCWLAMALFCFYVSGEEISWGERLTSFGVTVLRDHNVQGESNLHNLAALNGYLHVSFIASGLFLGWLGWKCWPQITALPARRYSLYFLIVALFYAYWDLSWISHGERIRNDQEAIEVLMAVGLFLHCWRSARALTPAADHSSGGG